MNDLTMTLTSRMPYVLISSKFGSDWRSILGHPQLIECMGICVLSMARVSELRGSDKISGNFSFNSVRVRALRWPLLGFFRDFSHFPKGGEGGLWGKSFIGNI